MKQIKLTQGKYALVDDEQYAELSRFKWSATKDPKSGKFYAVRTAYPSNKKLYMHRELMGNPEGMEVDHRDRDGLNCLMANLRVATHQQNQRNKRKYAGNLTSAFIGVHWAKLKNKWVARIAVKGKTTLIGYFKTERQAALARDLWAIELHGQFASLNFRPSLAFVSQE